MNDHPGIAHVSFGRIPTGPAALAVNERIAALLLAGHLTHGTAEERFTFALKVLVSGLLAQE